MLKHICCLYERSSQGPLKSFLEDNGNTQDILPPWFALWKHSVSARGVIRLGVVVLVFWCFVVVVVAVAMDLSIDISTF
jgi:hypothetical protein